MRKDEKLYREAESTEFRLTYREKIQYFFSIHYVDCFVCS